MRTVQSIFLLFFLVICSCNTSNETCNASSTELETLIKSHQKRESFDREKYPLGLYTREHYKAEAEYAESQLQYFDCIQMEELSETEQISAELLKFVLQDKIDYYKFERFLIYNTFFSPFLLAKKHDAIQLFLMKSSANASSNSGFDGGLVTRMSSTGSTMPRPKK